MPAPARPTYFVVRVMMSRGPTGVGIGLQAGTNRCRVRLGEALLEASFIAEPGASPLARAALYAIELAEHRSERALQIGMPLNRATLRAVAEGRDGLGLGRVLELARDRFDSLRVGGLRSGQGARARALARRASGVRASRRRREDDHGPRSWADILIDAEIARFEAEAAAEDDDLPF